MDRKTRLQNIVMETSRLLVGLVFVFSGFVKGVDPMGSVYKFEDYFTAFHLDFLFKLALPLAIVLIFSEFLIGMALVFRIKIKWAAWGALVFMSAFTPLTLVLALTNPVSDCGCFGDALVLTNWQTFIKNIFISVFTVLVFIYRDRYHAPIHPVSEWFAVGAFLLFIFGISSYGLRKLPLVDFRPYKVGTSIPEGLTIPEGKPHDEYETILIYEKEGEMKEFTMDNYPWQDSSWTFVDQRSFLVKKGYEPPIHDFNIIAPGGEDITEAVLHYPDYVFLLVATQLSESNNEGLGKAADLLLYCQLNDYPFYVLSSSSQADIENVRNQIGFNFEVHTMDETTLKTMIRSNPGLIILKEGTILEKYAWRELPPAESLSENIVSRALLNESHGKTSWRTYGLFLSFLLIFIVSQYRINARPPASPAG